MPNMRSLTIPPTLFQSAPDREVGRCVGATTKRPNKAEFQSAPDREVGRCLADFPFGLGFFHVSIRARP